MMRVPIVADRGIDDREKGPTESPLEAVLYAVLRFRKLVLATLVMGLAVGLGYGLVQPNSYASDGTLLLLSGARETETTESVVSGRATPAIRSFDAVAAELKILTQEDVYRRVVETVGASRIIESYDPAAEDDESTPVLTRWLHQIQSWWFTSGSDLQDLDPGRKNYLAHRAVMAGIELIATGGSMITVTFEAHTPELAKEVVDAFLAAAEEQHRKKFSKQRSLEFLISLEEEARISAQEVSKGFLEFKEENDLYDLDAERQSILEEIARLENLIATDAEKQEDQRHRRDFLQARLDAEPPLLELETENPATTNPEHSWLQQQLFLLRSQKLTIESSIKEVDELERRIEAHDKLIREAEGLLQETPTRIETPSTRQTVKNSRYEWLRTELDKSELELAALNAATNWASEKLRLYRERLEKLERLKPRYERFLVEIAQQQANENKFLEKRKELEIFNLLDEHQLSNLLVIPGNLPISKTGPNRLRLVVFGIAFAVMAGVALAFGLHKIDGTLRRPEDLQALGLESVAQVPFSPRLAGGQTDLDSLLDPSSEDPGIRALNSLWVDLFPGEVPTAKTTIAVTGDREAAGVTTVALCAAAGIARNLPRKVLLIETDSSEQELTTLLGLDEGPGFVQYALGEAGREAVVRPTQIEGLSVVPAGSLRQGTAKGTIESLIDELGNGFDIVVLDVPSILETPEYRQMIWCSDRVMPVFAAGSSPKAGARALLHAIASADKEIPGTVLNRWRSVKPFWLPISLKM